MLWGVDEIIVGVVGINAGDGIIISGSVLTVTPAGITQIGVAELIVVGTGLVIAGGRLVLQGAANVTQGVQVMLSQS